MRKQFHRCTSEREMENLMILKTIRRLRPAKSVSLSGVVRRTHSKKREEREQKEKIERDNKRIPATLFVEYAKMDDITLKAICKLLHIKTTDKEEAVKLLIDELTFLDEIYTRNEKEGCA
jgi:hypothetical protein